MDFHTAASVFRGLGSFPAAEHDNAAEKRYTEKNMSSGCGLRLYV